MLFAIDDSDIEIDGSPHTILAAMGVQDAAKLEVALAKLKADFGLSPHDEIKWNGMRDIPQRAREALSTELLDMLQDSVPLVAIGEGRDKQKAANSLARQIADYIVDHSRFQIGDRLDFAFDESILTDEREYVEFLHELAPSPVASANVAVLHSHESAAIQLADVLAGFNRLTTDIALGKSNKQIKVWDDGIQGDVEIDLLNYICVALRWPMWGEVPPPPNPENITFDGTWPFKHVGGYGLRIHSSISTATIEKIYASRIVYMGCMH